MPPAPKMAESESEDESEDESDDADVDEVEVSGNFEADEPADADVDIVDPDELPDGPEPEPESTQAEVVEEDGEDEEVVDPNEIDTVDLDPFSQSVDDSLDELNAATERAAAEAGQNAEPELDISGTDLGESAGDSDDSGSTGPFSADEQASTGSSGGGPGGQSDSDPGPFGDVSSQGDDELDEIIIEGFARAAVIKIEPKSEQSKLQTEFEEVFESFRLGYFGREVIYEYLVVDEHDNIDPIWGFFGSVLMCLVVVMWMRPDSDEITDKATESLSDLINGVRN